MILTCVFLITDDGASQVVQQERTCLPVQGTRRLWGRTESDTAEATQQQQQGTRVLSLRWEDALEKEMATHFSILA